MPTSKLKRNNKNYEPSTTLMIQSSFNPSIVWTSAKSSRRFPLKWRETQVLKQLSWRSKTTWRISWIVSWDEICVKKWDQLYLWLCFVSLFVGKIQEKTSSKFDDPVRILRFFRININVFDNLQWGNIYPTVTIFWNAMTDFLLFQSLVWMYLD